jgi:hypothetical protein
MVIEVVSNNLCDSHNIINYYVLWLSAIFKHFDVSSTYNAA